MNNPYGQSQDSVKRQMMSFFDPTEMTSHWHSEPGVHSSNGPALQESSMTNNIEVCVKIYLLTYPLTWKYPLVVFPVTTFLASCLYALGLFWDVNDVRNRSLYSLLHRLEPDTKEFTFRDMSTQSGSRWPLPHPPIYTHGWAGTGFRSAWVLITMDAGVWVGIGSTGYAESYPLCPCCPRCVLRNRLETMD